MKIKQTARHFATKKALEAPGIGDAASYGLAKFHTRIFLGKADKARREQRRDHLDGFFAATMDTYLAALKRGYDEAEAREITHIQANFDFYNHGWIEMMEIPVEEIEEHYERYRPFFEAFSITVEDPLGEFAPEDGVPEAPLTPEKLADARSDHEGGGFADDVYVENEDGEIHVGGQDEPEDVDVSAAAGVDFDETDKTGD